MGSTNGISDEMGSSSCVLVIGVFVKIFQGIAFISEVTYVFEVLCLRKELKSRKDKIKNLRQNR